MKQVLVTGASGNVGGAVTDALHNQGVRVKAATRRPDVIEPRAAIEPVAFDYEDESSYSVALAGCDGLFLVAPPADPRAAEKLQPFLQEAAEAGIEHAILLSAFGVDASEETPLRRLERALMATGVGYTILRPNFFMENFSRGFLAPSIRREGVIRLAAGDAKTSFIATADIAAVVAAAFAAGPAGAEHNLTGPEALDHHEVAALISAVAGRDVIYDPLSPEAMAQGLQAAGLAAGAVAYLGHLYEAVRAGWTAAVTEEVAAVTGRAPTSFKDFARRHASAWRG